MILTEKEAEETRCCGPEGCGRGVSVKRNDAPTGAIHYCIGSECMGWRWTSEMFDGPDSYRAEPGPKGYCGLAGLPLESQ